MNRGEKAGYIVASAGVIGDPTSCQANNWWRAAWLMATLTPSALMVALVQSASTLPFLLFGLMAGSLADEAARRIRTRCR